MFAHRSRARRSCAGSDVGFTSRFVFFLVCVLIGAAGHIRAAEVFLPAIGGGGGSQFLASCPAGQSLTGFELRAGYDIDAIRPLCVTAYSPVESTPPVLTTDSGLVSSPGSLGALIQQVAPGWYGGPGGHIERVMCPAETPIVIKISVAYETSFTDPAGIINNIHLFCWSARESPGYNNPSAIFDAPFSPPNEQHWESQICSGGQIAVGLHGRSGKYLDAMGLICDSPRIAPRPAGSPIKAQGRVQGTEPSGPPISICDAAQKARERNSPAAPGLEAQCRAQTPTLAAQGRVHGTEPSGPPIPICDAAGAARDRNSPAAPGLEAQCLALGGHLPPRPGEVNIAELATRGEAIVNADPLLTELRNQQPAGVRHGFDIGIARTGNDSEWGPGKQKTLDSLGAADQEGFKVASSFVLDRNRNAELAAIGAAITVADPVLAEARGAEVDARYWLGFDIATGIFGDPSKGAQGKTTIETSSLKIRDALSAPAQRGFNAAVALHLSRKY